MDTKRVNQISATKHSSLIVKTTIKSGPGIDVGRR